MRTPAEIARDNRARDEAADDALLATWLPSAEKIVESDYRGEPVDLRLPGHPGDGETTAGLWGPKVRDPERFAGSVRRAVAGAGWTAHLEQGSPGTKWIRFSAAQQEESP